MSKKVFVEGGDLLVTEMFAKRGWTIQDTPYGVDLICLTGGADVSPMLYETEKMGGTVTNPQRDEKCSDLFLAYSGDVPMVGICRGGQFLNVMVGGELYQDIDGHHNEHDAYDPATGQVYKVSSVHHQMMIPTDEGEVVLCASYSTYREPDIDYVNTPYEEDVEAVLYEDDKIFCFQPHPEYHERDHECQKLFFHYIDELLGSK